MPSDNYPSNSNEFTISTDELLADIERAEKTAETISEANGEHRSNLKAILDDRGYHKKAFADFRAMAAMSDSKFSDYWRTFIACVDAYTPVAEQRLRDLLDRQDAEASDLESDLAGGE